ncbi:hypothetical protein [Streptomyces sp. Da 82-17]|uniref:hypothetical protein n=1 Tax=Streptomyces sp. Da 82-17 TaxID=3377116 RepID=UPI0038D3EE1D
MNPSTADPKAWAARVWRQHQPNPLDRTLIDWITSTAADGRPLHTARVDHPDAVQLLHRAADRFDRSRLDAITQESPRLDLHAPGGVALVWLLNGEWIELWAPEPVVPAHEGDSRMTDTAAALIAVKEATVRAWYQFAGERRRTAIVPDWRVGRTDDGTPSLSCEVVGRDAAELLHQFADQSPLRLDHPGDLRPTFDYSTPGRTACVWRWNGVWVELWHPDTASTPVVEQRPERRLLRRPSGRLPFRRRLNTTKETAA